MTITTQFADSVRLPSQARAPKPARKSKTLAERLAAMVDTSAGIDACHPFTGSTMQANGYGQITAPSPITGKASKRNSHVVAWEVANGVPVPAGKIVLHAKGCCKTCCNARHLRIGTHAENAADAVAEGHTGKRLSKATILEIVMLHQQHGVSAAALAHRFQLDPSTTRRILRGQSHSGLTGIERHRGTGGRKASPAPATQTVVIDINTRRKAQPEPVAIYN